MKKIILFISIIVCVGLSFSTLAQNPELTLQTGHSGGITKFAFSFDGKYLASVGKDNIIIIWDFNLGKQLKILNEHHGKISSIKFLNHAYNLVSADEDGTLILWDIKAGISKNVVKLESPVSSFDIAKNDSLLAVAGNFPEIKLFKLNKELQFYKNIPAWNTKDSLRYIRAATIKGEKVFLSKAVCLSVSISNNNNELIVSRASVFNRTGKVNICQTIRCFVSTDDIIKTSENANQICYSDNYKNILMSVLPSRIISWNIEKNRVDWVRPGNFKKKNFINISTNANDSIIAALNEDGIIYIWKNSGQFLKTINQAEFNSSAICFHPVKNNLLVVGDEKASITIFDISTGNAIKKLESGIHPITSLAINNSGTMLAIAGNDNKIRVFELQNKISTSCFYGHKSNISGLSFTSDSSFVSTSLDNKICKWDIKKNQFTDKIKGNSNPIFVNALINAPVLTLFLNTITTAYFANNFLLHNYETLNSAAFFNNGKLMATGGKGFNKGLFYYIFMPRIFPIHIVDNEKMKKTAKLKAHYLSINAIDFNRTGTLLASTGKDYKTGAVVSRKIKNNRHSAFPTYNSLKIWDLTKHNSFTTFESPNEIEYLKFSPVNDSLVFADKNNNLVLFDYKNDTAQKIAEGRGPLLFDKNGKYLFFQDKTNSLIRWNLEQSKITNSFKGHNNKISATAIYPDEKQIATASTDGTLKIWNIEKGTEVVTLYAINDNDFIVKTPDYYYYATKNAKKEIGFTFGIKFYPFEQFDLQYNRPDIVLARLGIASDELINAYKMAYNKRLKKMGFSEDMFENDFHLPEVSIVDIEKLPLHTDDSKLAFSINANDSKYNLNRINVWVNNTPLYGIDGINLRQLQINKIEKNIAVELSQGINKIQISCLNEKGVESLKESFEVSCQPKKITKPDLYILAIGASEYQDKEWNLTYAAKDANDFSDIFAKQKANFDNIHINKLTNQEVTIENVRNIKQTLLKSKVDDIVMIFYAGHGLLDDSLDYYLGTYNINFSKPSDFGLKYDDLDNLLDSIPARNKILLIDACHSGEVDKESGQQLVAENITDKDIVFRGAKPRGYNSQSNIGYSNSFELMKEMFSDIRKGTGAVVVSSAGGGEFAFESESWKNGVFTYSLLNGINSFAADKNNDNMITISELQDYILKQVQTLTKGKQKPTIRQENIDNDFVLWRK